MARYSLDELPPKVLPNDVATQRKRKPGLLKPPLAHVRQQVQPAVLEGELALVDEEPRIDLASLHHIFDLVKGDRNRDEVGLPET
jgi:hypothetical protein